MKVKDLIAVLKEEDPESRVILNGYEEGFCDILSLEKLKIKLNVNKEQYNGPHDISDSNFDEYAVFIKRIDN